MIIGGGLHDGIGRCLMKPRVPLHCVGPSADRIDHDVAAIFYATSARHRSVRHALHDDDETHPHDRTMTSSPARASQHGQFRATAALPELRRSRGSLTSRVRASRIGHRPGTVRWTSPTPRTRLGGPHLRLRPPTANSTTSFEPRGRCSSTRPRADPLWKTLKMWAFRDTRSPRPGTDPRDRDAFDYRLR